MAQELTAADFRARLFAAGFSQRAFAEKIGVNASTTHRWAQGTVVPVPLYATRYLDLHIALRRMIDAVRRQRGNASLQGLADEFEPLLAIHEPAEPETAT